MDTTKIKAAITAAKSAVKDTIDAEIKNRSFNGLRALAGVDASLVKAELKIEAAVKRAAPREKKAKTKKAA